MVPKKNCQRNDAASHRMARNKHSTERHERCGMASNGTEQTLYRTDWYREETIKATMRHRIEWHGTDTPQNGMSRCGVARRAFIFIPQNSSEAPEAGSGDAALLIGL
eukprot:CAMPEP_0177242192 /NCGR_PEP_ID=MMETSP0367-20130122/48678_1 /TAXON_ID=447022 ORGANISM="Scrippsiella hangoei-like, Strain SHHI-4" /NCGR_SAMPLE_ID=MMETSP0367 /ASSEMBLY_ACC=CAM_ASM_000362 /LENGTH=106 /DNA_ID=CAMNT_0018693795 /DNA_START=198 /DNA_END=514 /DNA_ORIENTATION=+